MDSKGDKMPSAEQLIVVAYCHDGCILCRKCGEGNPETKMGEAMSAYEAGEYAGVNGLDCEECGACIEEPYTWTCPNCDTDYLGDEAEEAESEFDWGPNASHKCCEECPGDEKPDQADWTVYKTDDYEGTVTRHNSQEEAETRITEIEKTDPDGVHRGDYSIDGPTE